MWQQRPKKKDKKKMTLRAAAIATHPSPRAGYHNRTMPALFYQALGIQTPEEKGSWRCSVVPFYTRRIPISKPGQGRNNIYYLVDVATHYTRAVRVLTIIDDTTIHDWRTEQTKEYVVDQTTEAMRAVMLQDIKYCPLRKWNDATWFYTWRGEPSSCTLIPFIEVAHDDLRVQRPTNYAWMRIPRVLKQMAEIMDKGLLHQEELEDAF